MEAEPFFFYIITFFFIVALRDASLSPFFNNLSLIIYFGFAAIFFATKHRRTRKHFFDKIEIFNFLHNNPFFPLAFVIPFVPIPYFLQRIILLVTTLKSWPSEFYCYGDIAELQNFLPDNPYFVLVCSFALYNIHPFYNLLMLAAYWVAVLVKEEWESRMASRRLPANLESQSVVMRWLETSRRPYWKRNIITNREFEDVKRSSNVDRYPGARKNGNFHDGGVCDYAQESRYGDGDWMINGMYPGFMLEDYFGEGYSGECADDVMHPLRMPNLINASPYTGTFKYGVDNGISPFDF